MQSDPQNVLNTDQSVALGLSGVSFPKRFVAGVVLLNLFVISLMCFSLYRSFAMFQNRADVTAQNLSNVLSQNIDGLIDKIDLGLMTAAEEIEHQMADGSLDDKAITSYLGRLQDRLPLVVALRATDEYGWTKYGRGIPQPRGVNVTDRAYFIHLRDDPHAGLFINKPVMSKIDKIWVVNFARRINHPDGSFAGVIFANISLENLGKLFSTIDVGHRGAINLRDEGLGLIARYPVPPDIGAVIGDKTISPEFHHALNSGSRHGTFYTPTSFDGTPRVVSFNKVDSYPLFVTVGVAREDYLLEWWQEVMQMSGLGALFILISTLATRLITRAWVYQLNTTKKLAMEEEKFHTVVDYTYDWEYWEGANHEILYMAPSCERVTGYTPAEFVSDPGLLLRIIHLDDRYLMETHLHDGKDTETAEVDFRIVRRDGEVRWISHCCQQVRGRDGSYMGRRVTNRDMTDRHLFEVEINRLAQAVEQNPTGILITDMNGQPSYTNQAFTRISGYTFSEAYVQAQRDLVSTEMTDAEYAELQQFLVAGKPWHGVVQNRHKNGDLRWEMVSASPIYDEAGKVSSYLFLRTDITEHKRNEEELRRYKDHLEEEVQQRTADLILARNAAEAANQAKSVFLANMSHELRTPLNAILGFSNMMRKDPLLQNSMRQNLDIINRSGEHLLILINDVLEMAKIEAGRVQLENSPFDLGGMVRDVTDMMEIRAKEKGLRLLIDQSSKFPRYIIGDEARLRQVLINLLGNAVKFTQEGGVTIRLGTKSNTISHLLIEIEDSGPGIADVDQKRIFEPFVQLGNQGGNKGTGLGLTITRQFVELMGGQISVESVVGKGSLFRIDLPLHEASESDVMKPKEASMGEVIGLVPGQPEYRILVVEDQLENQLLMAKLMEAIGLKVKVAENGKQGVELFQSWHPHLIWMDRQMPVMDGAEATRIIRTLPGGNDVKIVAVTASAFKEQRSEMLDAGMDDFVRKPYRFREVYDSLAKQLGVQYIYEGIPVAEEQVTLTPAMLASLSVDMRNELKTALESLDSVRIAHAIEQAASHDQGLRKTLMRLVDNFDYPAILNALKTN